MNGKTIIVSYSIYKEGEDISDYLVRFDKNEFIAFMKDIYPEETFEAIMKYMYVDEDILEAKSALDYEEVHGMSTMCYTVEYEYEYDEIKKVAFHTNELKPFMEVAYPEDTFEDIMKQIYTSEDTFTAMECLYYEKVVG